MKAVILLIVSLLCFPVLRPLSAATPTTANLLGKWEGTTEFGKMKFRMVLRIVETNNRITATMDLPDQGRRGIPIAAVLFNAPDVRIEIDPFQTAYNGKLSEDLPTIVGELEEGPGGRPAPMVFNRSTASDAPEPEKVFTFKPGETRDIRGHWKSSIEAMPGMTLTFGLNVARVENGSFQATLDVLEQGASDIPASAVTASGREVEMKWDGLQITFKGELSDDANRMAGEWKQRTKPTTVTFTRIDAPATLTPKNVSYTADPNDPDDVRGEWTGHLKVPGQKLRLILKLGKSPEGAFAGSLASPDQGPGELPMGNASFKPPKITMEWPGIRGTFEGILTNNGTTLEGTWEQFGNKMPLTLNRASANNDSK